MADEEITATAALLIRRPPKEVFEAFVDPAVTTKFWFTDSTGPLAAGEPVRWTWSMYDHSVDVDVKIVEPYDRILVEWGQAGERTWIEWRFTEKAGGTFVEIANGAFDGTPDEIARQAVGSTEAFTMVLAGLKAFLEHGIQLDLIADRFPDGLST